MNKKMFASSGNEVINELNSNLDGLSLNEANKRLQENGENKLIEKKADPLIVKFLKQFSDVMVIILLCAAFITSLVAIYEKNYSEFIDVGIILAIVLINAIIGVVQEQKAENALEALKKMNKTYVKVKRDNEISLVESHQIVVGDIVLLEAGDVVPADIRLLNTYSLKVEESSLTGESVAVEKDANLILKEDAPIGDRKNMVFSTGVITYGRGEGIVVATGMDTEIGHIAAMLSNEEEEKTPIQKKLDKTGKIISLIVIAVALLIFIIRILSSINLGVTIDVVIDAFMTSVAIAVAAIPEGLTAVITIIMAIGMQKMSKHHAIIKKIPAVETLGSTQIICSDKTGTLTLNKMTVKETYSIGEEAKLKLYQCMALCNDSKIKKENGKITFLGDPTETALFDYLNLNENELFNKILDYPRIDELPFDSDRKLMTTVNKINDEELVFTKGAVDQLLEHCSYILINSELIPLSNEEKEKVLKVNTELAKKALRVLAYAYKEKDGSSLEENLVFVGLTGMIDPPRVEVKAAVATCHKAGITPIMITGDHKDTAFAIAKELNIANDETQVITGQELSLLDDKTLKENVEQYRVYARVSPEHKVRIVKAWKSKGKIVAMTGDGVNDAPSIKAADIGIGMGITGTDVTKNAADMILEDDNFSTIVVAVKEGRKIFDNMQKTIQFLLAANIAEVLSLLIATIVFSISGDTHAFLLPIQILWINLVTDSFPALALGMEEGDNDIMNNPPRKNQSHLFAGHLGSNIIYQGIIQTLLIVTLFFVSLKLYGHGVASTMAFLTLCLIQLFHCYNNKSLLNSIFNRNIFKNKVMNLAFVVGLILTLSVAFIPGLRYIFHLTSLNIVQWIIVIFTSILILPLVELIKLIIRRNKKLGS